MHRESNDSGTESDGELLDVENKRHLDVDMETSLSSCTDANSPSTDTACSSESSAIAAAAAAMMCHQTSSLSCAHLMYDQHSSEEELEVINGPSAATAHKPSTSNNANNSGTTASSACASRLSNRGCTSSLDTEAPYDERATTSAKRSSSTLMVENRKRSLAHSSDDEFRNSLEPILTPVNFRTSPPLEAFKPNRSHMMFRSTTPLILSEARCGIENIKLCDNSVNEENGSSKCPKLDAAAPSSAAAAAVAPNEGSNENEPSIIKLKMSNSSHHIYQPQPKYSFHYNSSRSSPASTTGLDNMEVRSVSPPAKLFHCAISPRRRPSNNIGGAAGVAAGGETAAAAATQRLQRAHRPCLDFDKMQQVSL
ncbi:uncharacterized protein LOC108608564 isoform X2 [Drosophila busckii]|uniref:uncharacterized protein LOC108608564 isoform X2 n=1 Tax=Drosophila busckii TaxID=30019 RepID=UPI00083EE19B|nr:uncharacterized protein LOC108608564 isoform X2 [Drosophila busckii]